MAPPSVSAPNVREMVVVHNGFRQVFGEVPGLLRRVPDGDRNRARRVAGHLRIGLDLLHEHHTSEDTRLWPILLERAKPHHAVIERMEAQHERVAALLDAAAEQCTRYEASASAHDARALADIVDELLRVADEHLSDEEENILPLCERHVSVEEWNAMGGGEDATPKQLLVFLSAIEANNTPEDVKLLLQAMPTPVRVVLRPLVLRPLGLLYRRRLLAA